MKTTMLTTALLIGIGAALALPTSTMLAAPEAGSAKEPKKSKKPAAKPAAPKVGDTAPAWTLKDASGSDHSLESYKGKIVVIDLWATWCGPCKAAMPKIQKLHETYKDQGVVVLGINTWEEKSDAAVKYMKDKGYTYGLLLKGDDVADAYGVSGIPTFYAIGPDGKIIYHGIGATQETEEGLEKAIKDAIAANKPKGG